MRAVACEALGDPTKPLGAGVLALRTGEPVPALPSEDHIRIRVAAASLNYPDALQIQGSYQDKPQLPFLLGKEAAGVVTAVGSRVRGFKVGDAAAGVGDGGAFAEEWCVHQGSAWRVPDGLDPQLAAALPIAYGTADLALRARGRLEAGQTLLVLGASGGVGTAAVQIGKLVGARVVAVTSGAAKADYLRGLGADAVVDAAAAPKGTPLHKLIRAAAPKGVNVVFDPVGGPLLPEALKTLAWGAQYLVIGFVAGIPKVPANLLLVKNTTVHGVFWGSYMQRAPKVLRASMDQVFAWAASGQLRVPVSARVGLEGVPGAMAALLGRGVMGKVLIVPGGGGGDAAAAGVRARL
ncbi:quinone oxidoreductase [Raphidocelis subcapitata]|uniref:Quinone oxidoreductase n=1 Tax=Raphidocelis subcapitata TaxID=307507 RepID=A0A2V0PD46_9CHLO|nr:quinone oxidoreductase [Raphidocelis subcapitata]|eukprot:GBF97766.1 quinone oxidoreductase [Raphidocelis subcapitata]